jgi:uncharacterized coiled-coil protein SlyX
MTDLAQTIDFLERIPPTTPTLVDHEQWGLKPYSFEMLARWAGLDIARRKSGEWLLERPRTHRLRRALFAEFCEKVRERKSGGWAWSGDQLDRFWGGVNVTTVAESHGLTVNSAPDGRNIIIGYSPKLDADDSKPGKWAEDDDHDEGDTVAELRGTIWRLEDDLTEEREEVARAYEHIDRLQRQVRKLAKELVEARTEEGFARDTINAWIKQAAQPGGRVKRPATPSVDVGAMWDD